jgi:hypothetical protein
MYYFFITIAISPVFIKKFSLASLAHFLKFSNSLRSQKIALRLTSSLQFLKNSCSLRSQFITHDLLASLAFSNFFLLASLAIFARASLVIYSFVLLAFLAIYLLGLVGFIFFSCSLRSQFTA